MWIDLLERFQTLAVGAVGFLGVIITLWCNARQTRRQRQEEQQHEREALRAALIEELKIHRESLIRNTEHLPRSRDCAVPTDPMDDAYRAFTHRIGLLSRAEVRAVMLAYLTLRTFIVKLFLIGTPFHASRRHVRVPAENIPLLSGMQENLIHPIEEAIEAMERAQGRGVGPRQGR